VAKTAFSDVLIRSLPFPERGQKAYWDEKLPTFGIRVSQGGTKTFILNRDNNFITIGRFGVLSLSEARSEARRLLAEFTLGKVRPQSITYPQAVQAFLEDKARAKRPRTVADYKRLLNRLPFKGQLSDITHDDTMRKLNRFTAPSEREHLRVAATVFFNWCIRRRYISENPFSGLAPTKSTSRSRILSDAEIKSVWTVADQIGGHYGTIVKLLIATGQRRGEIVALQSSWVKDDHIVLPKEICKNGREHLFPIGQLVTGLIKTAQQGLLFPAQGSTTKPFNGWKSKTRLDKLTSVINWTLHDLRRTFATRLAEMGVAPHVIERLLNHVTGSLSPIALVYNKAKYLEEMREAMNTWEARVAAIVA
jgi:integrase